MVIGDIGTVAVVAIALGADAFSMALGMGMAGIDHRFKVGFTGTVGLLHVLMPLAGLQLGLAAGKFLGVWAAWAGALVLVILGLDMLKKGFKANDPPARREAGPRVFPGPRSGWIRHGGVLATGLLGISVSVDALAAGFSLGTSQVPIALAVGVMGMVAAIMTAGGFAGGKWLGQKVGKGAQMAGGGILLLLAVQMII